MNKAFFNQIFNILVSPGKTWDNIVYEEEQTQKENPDTELSCNVFRSYVLPLVSILTLATFIGMYHSGLEIAIKNCISIFISNIAAFYISVYIIKSIGNKFYDIEINENRTKLFVGYSSTPIYVIGIITNLLQLTFFLKIFYIYTAYIIWEGITILFKVKNNDKGGFLVFTTLVIMLMPIAIKAFFSILLTGF